MKFLPKLHGILIAGLTTQLRYDDVHWLPAEWTKAVDLILLQDLAVAASVHMMSTRVNRVQIVHWTQVGPVVVVCLGNHGNQAVNFVFLGLFTQTAEL
jgi:hypothetical protein